MKELIEALDAYRAFRASGRGWGKTKLATKITEEMAERYRVGPNRKQRRAAAARGDGGRRRQ